MAYSQQREILESAIKARGGTDWLFEKLSEGRTIKALAAMLGVPRTSLSKWLNLGDRKKRLVEAQAEAAFAITEESQDIADEIKPVTGTDGTTVIVPMSEAIAKARIQIDVRRERAAVLNREVFGRAAPAADRDLGEILVGALTAVAKRHQPAQLSAARGPEPVEIVVEPKPA